MMRGGLFDDMAVLFTMHKSINDSIDSIAWMEGLSRLKASGICVH